MLEQEDKSCRGPRGLTTVSSNLMSKAQEAQQFLDDLESWTPANPSPTVPSVKPPAGGAPSKPGEAADVIAFLDEITQKTSEPTRSTLLEKPASRAGTPTLRKSTERVRMGAPSSLPLLSGNSTPSSPATARSTETPASATASGSSTSTPTPQGATQEPPTQRGWGWGGVGSVWSTASAALQQARTVVDEQVKNLPNNEHAKKWGAGALEYAKTAQEYAKTAQLDKLGAFRFGPVLCATADIQVAQGKTSNRLAYLRSLISLMSSRHPSRSMRSCKFG
jgi:hypothetical protein